MKLFYYSEEITRKQLILTNYPYHKLSDQKVDLLQKSISWAHAFEPKKFKIPGK